MREHSGRAQWQEDNTRKDRLSRSGEHGQYNKADWLKESQHHLLSAKMLRECSAEKKGKDNGASLNLKKNHQLV